MLFDSVCKIRMPKAKTKLNYIKPQKLFIEGKRGKAIGRDVLLVYYDNSDLYEPPWAWAFNWQSLAKDAEKREREKAKLLRPCNYY